MSYFITGKINKFDAVHSLVGGAISSLDDKIIYHGGQTPPSDSDIDAEIIRLQAEYDAQEYARNRKAEYDALNQFEMQYDDEVNGTTTWKDAIAAIKAKYPKP